MSVAAIYQLETPFADDELAAIGYEQTGDGVVFSHLDHFPQLLRRYDHNLWTIGDAPIAVTGTPTASVLTVVTNPNNSESADGYVESPHQYAVSVIDEAVGRESQVTDGPTVQNDITVKGNFNTVSWDAVAGSLEYRVYRKRNGSYGYVGTVDATGTLEFIDDNIIADFSDGPPQANNPFTDEKYPATVTFHGRRTWYGRTLAKPGSFFASQVDDLFNHDKSRPLRATDSIAANYVGRRVNAIRHLVSQGELVAFTTDGIFSIRPGGDGVLSPVSLQTKTEGYKGVGDMRPEVTGDDVFYATARSNAICTLRFTFERDGFRGNDLTVFAPHFFRGHKVIASAWCEHPASILFVLRDDGKLVAMTWQPEQEVWGWTLCQTGGTIESICSVSEDERDVLYAVVQREIDGELRRYTERMAEPLWIDEEWTDLEQAIIVDCARQFTADPPTKVVTGVDWLEGEAVSILADGLVVTDRTIVNGRVTPDLPNAAAVITVGKAILSYARTLPVVVTSQSGSTKGKRQSVSSVVLEVMNSVGLRVGSGMDPDPLTLFDAPLPETVGDRPMDPYSGLLDTLGMEADDWHSAKVTVAQDKPLPMVVLGIFPDIEFGG